MSDIDILADAQKEVSSNSLAYLMGLGEQLQTAMRNVEQIELELKEAKRIVNEYQSKTIPDAMIEIGCTMFALTDGTKIELKEVVSAGIPKDSQDEAYEWLREHGAGDLIKTEVTIKFGRGDEEAAREFFDSVEDKNPEMSVGVHSQTLSAWAREQLSKGVQLPMDLLGIWTGNIAKVVLPRKKKGEANG